MGLIKAGIGAVGGVLADQWKEYFYCESFPPDILAGKGQKRTTERSVNTKGEDNIISSGSVIAVADGQCMLIVEQGKVVDLCAEPGEYTYDATTEPSVFAGDLGEALVGTLKNMGKRFTAGGQAMMDQRVYYINTKEIIGNKYGTASPVPFRVVDHNVGLDMDISIRCFGEYSYRITNPILFYTNIMGNVSEVYPRSDLDSQLRTELMTALQPAFAQISAMGIRYSALPGYTSELARILNDILSAQWRDLRGLEIVAFGVSSVKASDEDEMMIKELQRNAAFRSPDMAAAHLVGAQAKAMQDAAANEGAGAAMAFMGMNLAGQAGGMQGQQLYQMGQDQRMQGQGQAQGNMGFPGQMAPQAQPTPPAQQEAPGPQDQAAPGPVSQEGWACACGSVNRGKFCPECGSPKPAAAPVYQCDKCGWRPEDPTKAPKFCPECGDPFTDDDIKA